MKMITEKFDCVELCVKKGDHEILCYDTDCYIGSNQMEPTVMTIEDAIRMFQNYLADPAYCIEKYLRTEIADRLNNGNYTVEVYEEYGSFARILIELPISKLVKKAAL